MSGAGILVVVILTFTALQYCMRKGGPIFMAVLSCYLACITAGMRTVSTPISKPVLFISALFNQAGVCLVDAPFFTIVALYTTPYNKAKIFAVF